MKDDQQKINEIYSQFIGKYFLQNQIQEDYGMYEGSMIEIEKWQFEQLTTLNELLHEYLLIQRKYKEVILNHNEIYETILYYEQQLTICQPRASGEIQRLAFVDINRRMTNFLTSFNSLIYDFLEKYMVPHLFGEKSSKTEEFSKKTNYWFDNNFYYKFLVSLRDYATHRDLPIQIVKFDFQYDKNKSPQMEVRCALNFRKSTLLSNSRIKNKMKGSLDGYAEEFPVLPFLENIKLFLEKLLCDFVSFCDSKFIDMAKEFMTYYKVLPDPDLLSFGEISKDGKIRQIFFQNDIISQILNCE